MVLLVATAANLSKSKVKYLQIAHTVQGKIIRLQIPVYLLCISCVQAYIKVTNKRPVLRQTG
jgi:hypothetical protein